MHSAQWLLLFAPGVFAGFSPSSASNVAVYWDELSSQAKTLTGPAVAASNSKNYHITVHRFHNPSTDENRRKSIQLAFLTVVHGTGGQPEINFANAGDNCTTFEGTALLNCPQIAADIATCQQTYGKTILLSIGGATYTEGGFSSPDDAVAAANQIWATFGPEQSDSSALRPFGSSSVDGFDFDFETTVSNTVPFANQLRSLMDAETSKPYYLTAAPQCPYPDAADDPMLNGTVSMDAVFVQFYNNYCGVQSYVPGSDTQNNFNFATWDNWAKTVSLNPNVKVLLGIPAGQTAAGSGYEPPSTLGPIIDYCKQFSSFGGVMMWDASQAVANSGFLPAVKQSLTSAASMLKKRMMMKLEMLVEHY
ncbi:MAG: hypothetical protein Q9190_000084 [Brigantiaea leucoxantha]